MFYLDYDEIQEMLFEYLGNEELEGKSPQVVEALEVLQETLEKLETYEYRKGEIPRVLNSFKPCAESEDERENLAAIKGVKSVDVAYIASHYGFIYGLLYAENSRLHFYKYTRKQEIEIDD